MSPEALTAARSFEPLLFLVDDVGILDEDISPGTGNESPSRVGIPLGKGRDPLGRGTRFERRSER